ncbi:MAG: GDP-mannose 4,6-dehydratase [Chloroflexi bacterium]|nr:GDP-mannose 4,6-dehydratase [Chloroflexota bacterium]
MRVLITGITGFAGSHLADVCVAQGADVWGLAHTPGPHPHLAHLGDRVQLHSANIVDEDGMQAALAAIRPDRIFHLAAQAHVPTAWQDPAATLTTNILGQLHVILAMQQHVPAARLLVVSSSNVYGMVEEKDIPVSETAPLRPADPYAVSKVGQDMLALQYWQSHGLSSVRVRPFNHIGPRQAPDFVIARFARELAEMEAGLRPPNLTVGNMSAKRDFTDVRDVARAYWLALEKGTPGAVYTIGSGAARSIDEMLQIMLGLTQVEVRVETDPTLLRPGDLPILQADPRAFQEQTGWRTTIPLEQTLLDTLDYWRFQVRADSNFQ